jgi:hypothetical protein
MSPARRSCIVLAGASGFDGSAVAATTGVDHAQVIRPTLVAGSGDEGVEEP